MPDPSVDALAEALSDRYLFERELGRGGMATVYLAHDRKHDRSVALKVLLPELAAALGPDRFLREIGLTARLDHPHILPVFDSGEAGGFLWYTMPYVVGESLRHRLNREVQLPIDPAVAIAREVADALDYAHRHGVVHRDIKPENILLGEGHARVADFGVARAVEAAGGGKLTETGLAIGTPAYMSPEQASAGQVDARSDVYALGCVVYEMLAGEPPYTGPTAQAVIAKRLSEPVPHLGTVRAVPPAIEAAVTRALAKAPADRFMTAGEFATAIRAETTLLPRQRPEGLRRGRWMVAGGVAALALVLVIASLTHRERPLKVDRAVVAVAPFRVSGADSSLGYLREGMVDLLAAKLSGTSGLRAADPRTLLVAWRRAAGRAGDLAENDAIRVAEKAGAGRLIEGDVVGTRQQITVNAVLRDAPGGTVGARASVEGSPDSLPRLVDRLAGKLLALEAGEGEQRLASLTSTSFPALRAYLEGQALVRRGWFKQAADKFRLALEQDSTFALAGLGLMRASEWLEDAYAGSDTAWQYRTKLAPRDRALLDAYLGSRWPAPRLYRDGLATVERYVQLAPDDAEGWYKLGDDLYHNGALLGIPDALPRAAEAFGRALALDSSFAPALQHGVVLALLLGDTAGARAAHTRMLRVDPASARVSVDRWMLAVVLGDSAERRRVLQDDSLDATGMVYLALALGLPMQDADKVFRRQFARAATALEQQDIAFAWHYYAIATGQPSRAVPLPASMPEPLRLTLQVIEARFDDGDSAAGAEAGSILERAIGTTLYPSPEFALARFAAGQHALDRGRFEIAARAIVDLRNPRSPPDSIWLAELPSRLALILENELAARRKSPDLPRLLTSLDSVMTNAGDFGAFGLLPRIGNLVAARLYHEQGLLPQALAAIRRHAFGFVDPLVGTYHLEEGRLAALNGDREGAIRAYRRYLALRSSAEPRLQPQVAQVRAELEALERESSDR